MDRLEIVITKGKDLYISYFNIDLSDVQDVDELLQFHFIEKNDPDDLERHCDFVIRNFFKDECEFEIKEWYQEDIRRLGKIELTLRNLLNIEDLRNYKLNI